MIKRLTLTIAAGLPTLAMLALAQPKLRLSEVEDVAPVRYQARLDLDPAKPSFPGTIAIQVSVHKPVQTLWLNANRIQVKAASAVVGGKTYQAAAVPGGDDFLGLKFASPLPAGNAEIDISYTAEVRHGDSSAVFHLKDKDSDYIFTQFEETDARGAFPCFDEPGYKTPWQLTLRVPAADSAVSNTPETERTEGGTKTYTFQETKPLPSYLVAFAVGPFEYVNAGTAGSKHVPVRIVTPKGRSGEAKYAAEVTATILTRLEDYFGIPYPYEKADQVSVPITTGFGAMENAGMVTYGQTIILADPASDTIARQRNYASDCAHELSHQWFGDLVTTAWWNDIWLNEAFATWSEQRLLATWKPEWQTRVEDVGSKLGAEEVDSLVSTRKIRQPILTKDDISNAFDAITYQKGAAVIGMFESWMGPEQFRKGVQAYLKRYAFRTATEGDFLDSLSSESKQDIAGAFSTFLNQPGVPVVSLTLDCAQTPPVLHTAQSRSLPAGSKGSTDQVWQIPLCVRVDGSPAPECTLLTKAKQDVVLRSAKSCPAWVEGNADAGGYYLVDYRGELRPALTAHAAKSLGAAERVDLIGNASFLTDSGKLPAADALQLVGAFHDDPQREVVERALGLALGMRAQMVPASLMPNFQRFFSRNFDVRARQMGWLPRAGESDDERLLRPRLVGAVARYGGDQELAKQARALTDKWLADRKAVPPEIVSAMLTTAAFYGDLDLYHRFFETLVHTQDNLVKQRLLAALGAFRIPAALEEGYQAALDKKIPLVDGFPLLLAGQGEAETRGLSFDFIEKHFDALTAGHPNIFGNDLGSYLPMSGGGFCDAQSRSRFQAFFAPRVDKFQGAPRNFAQVLESIDLCIAQKSEQEASVKSFLEKY
ncbi:MAG TPA: M1 family metallopeptidase [Bryobacteraceae bacterium]|nr:M1 family metallopeptidase [Bryobacteraceae bacterium]